MRRSPYISEHEDSANPEQPRNLHDFVRWLRAAWEAETPLKMHSHETDAGGSPELHGEFRAHLMGSVFALDDDGDARRPMAVNMARWASGDWRARARATFLRELVIRGYSVPEAWEALTSEATSLTAVARDDFAYRTLVRFWDLCKTPPRVYPPRPKEGGAMARVGKSEAQHRAEEAAMVAA